MAGHHASTGASRRSPHSDASGVPPHDAREVPPGNLPRVPPHDAPVGALRRTLLGAEDWLDGWSGRRRARAGRSRPATIDAHAGYAHAGGTEVLGRALEEPSLWTPSEADGRLANLVGVGRLFATRELPHAAVELRHHAGTSVATTDEEGYLRATLPARPLPPDTRWDAVAARVLPDGPDGADETRPVAATGAMPPDMVGSRPVELPILRVGRSARFGVISDIDDTVMRTGAENLARNLWTTFTGNPLTREVYERVPALYRGLARHGGRRANPIFYLSSSPWNLYGLIRDVLTRNGVPWGPIFLRDFGLDERKFIKGTHGQHKLSHARALMQAHDGLPFLLIGDLGQADAEIYAELARERPGAMLGVILHQPSDRRHDAKRRHVDAIEAAGVPTLVTRDYAEAEGFARARGWLGDDAPVANGPGDAPGGTPSGASGGGATAPAGGGDTLAA